MGGGECERKGGGRRGSQTTLCSLSSPFRSGKTKDSGCPFVQEASERESWDHGADRAQ